MSERHLLVVEDVQFFEGKKATQLELFHTIEHLRSVGARIVLTGDRLPRDIPKLDLRLTSQMSSGLVVEVELPDAQLRRKLLIAKASAGGVNLPEPCLNRLVEAVRRERLGQGGLDAFLHEFELSSKEGVVLMCLAEALLRVPDAATVDDVAHRELDDLAAARARDVRHLRHDRGDVARAGMTADLLADAHSGRSARPERALPFAQPFAAGARCP